MVFHISNKSLVARLNLSFSKINRVSASVLTSTAAAATAAAAAAAANSCFLCSARWASSLAFAPRAPHFSHRTTVLSSRLRFLRLAAAATPAPLSPRRNYSHVFAAARAAMADRDILPDNFKPVHYDLAIKDLDFEKWIYNGSVRSARFSLECGELGSPLTISQD